VVGSVLAATAGPLALQELDWPPTGHDLLASINRKAYFTAELPPRSLPTKETRR
jgi:hypothetical protein